VSPFPSFILPRDSGEGGPSEREAIGWWKGRGPRRISFDESETASQTPPPPRFAWSPSPAIAGEDALSRSRGAIFARAPSFPANHVVFGASLLRHPWVSLRSTQATDIRGSGTPRDACLDPRRAARGALSRSALASRRPTAALARETAGPQGSASGHASGDSPGRSILYGRPYRGAETLRFSAGITRAGKTKERHCLRTASTSHTGPSAGTMMPDAARERVTSPPAGTALAPSQGVSSRRTSLRKARCVLLVRRAGWIQEIPETRRIVLIRRDSFFAVCLIREHANCGIAAMIRIFPLSCGTRRSF
jgi:hypothetical protein